MSVTLTDNTWLFTEGFHRFRIRGLEHLQWKIPISLNRLHQLVSQNSTLVMRPNRLTYATLVTPGILSDYPLVFSSSFTLLSSFSNLSTLLPGTRFLTSSLTKRGFGVFLCWNDRETEIGYFGWSLPEVLTFSCLNTTKFGGSNIIEQCWW